MKRILWTLLLLYTLQLCVNADRSVHILAENLEQIITSSTLEWVPSTGNDKEILEQAVVAAHQTVEEVKDNAAEPSDNENEASAGFVNKPVYVCRAKINTVWVSGQLRPKKHVCVVSLYKKVSEYKQFDILVNIEGSSRLSWVHKDKYKLISQGAVSSGENPLRTFVARRSTKSHNKEGSLTHNVGIFDKEENLGVFHVVDQNDIEIQEEDGEILVETEPIRYELKSIKFSRLNPGKHHRKQKLLGQTVLRNRVDGLQRVDSVISYNYTYSLFWGKGHGLLTGLPFTVTFPNGTQMEGQWAITQKEEKTEVAPIEWYLESGTAVNVTLKGNYTESEIPYAATVVSFYKDGKTREITIRDTKRENKMIDIVAEYSPAYFLHNNTLIPTTAAPTTITTTTTSTTSRTTSTTQEVAPISPPEVVSKKKIGDGSQSKNNENDIEMSDEQTKKDLSSIKKKETESKDHTNGIPPINTLAPVIVTVFIMLLRVT